jgi:hypothetical protein
MQPSRWVAVPNRTQSLHTLKLVSRLEAKHGEQRFPRNGLLASLHVEIRHRAHLRLHMASPIGWKVRLNARDQSHWRLGSRGAVSLHLLACGKGFGFKKRYCF